MLETACRFKSGLRYHTNKKGPALKGGAFFICVVLEAELEANSPRFTDSPGANQH